MTTIDAAALAQGEYMQAGGYKTHYHEAGSGETVLFIHGSGPGVTAWANWRLTLPGLAQKFHVLALDVLGFGYSERPDGVTYAKSVWVDHLLAFLDAKDVRRCSIVGNSMGGGLALAIATRRPELVHKLVLMGSSGVRMELTPALDKVWGYQPSREAMRELLTECFAYDTSFITRELVDLRYAASIQPGFQESYGSMFPAPRQRGIDDLASDPELLGKIASPALIIHGREDKVVPLSASYKLFELLPDAELHVFGKCGHWTQIERTAQFNQLVDFFLSG